MLTIRKIKFTYTQIIVLGTFALIFLGAILLSLPISARNGVRTPFINSLFTASSAFCVTGLIVYDTYTHWSLFGQIVILMLIQIGGLGFMTIITLFSLILKRRIGLKERRLLMESANTLNIGGIVRLVKKIIKRTFIIEGMGAILLTIRFYQKMGLLESIYYGIFHSISAFCNAGFDLMGKYQPFSSLTKYCGDIGVNLTIMSLIVIGGLGFLVWEDILENKLSFYKYHLHSKIVITVTIILIIGGALLFYIWEENNSMVNMSIYERILASLFQSVTPRTAGFNTINQNNLSESGSLLTMLLMIIGGSPGSTAGGIKTTTFAVLIIGSISSAKKTSEITIYKRKLEKDALKKACSIAIIYMTIALVFIMILCSIENFSLKQISFEVFSALSTVGLTMNVTSNLTSNVSKLILSLLMYGGKVGVLSLAAALSEKKEIIQLSRPAEKIVIG
ncbi:TrkH family potassium uptake protein [Garciella nitratireducens]|uniref:TrkH family potassium uptake protein n=1 Tax=Garciella nitratireducens TaxID=218205 RepID=UPI000DEBBCFA|nr:TrkH family potassium uptake protein [Garciella nitratireducens]RBP37421.1 trk system potassium uptake protein TrkH [Garciella nitratireducens]